MVNSAVALAICSPSRAAELGKLRACAAGLRGVLHHDLHSVLEQ